MGNLVRFYVRTLSRQRVGDVTPWFSTSLLACVKSKAQCPASPTPEQHTKQQLSRDDDESGEVLGPGWAAVEILLSVRILDGCGHSLRIPLESSLR